MINPLAPKPRTEVDQRYYTTGMSISEAAPRRFTQHSAEPNYAASILQRNPHHSEVIQVKPSVFRTSSLVSKYDPSITSLSLAKNTQSKEYA